MIIQDRETLETFLLPLAKVKSGLSETKHQAKIIRYLEGLGFEVIKISVANKAGNSDLVACSTEGQFYKIEVKDTKGNKPSKLQLAKLKRYWYNKAVCMVAYGFEDFKVKYKML